MDISYAHVYMHQSTIRAAAYATVGCLMLDVQLKQGSFLDCLLLRGAALPYRQVLLAQPTGFGPGCCSTCSPGNTPNTDCGSVARNLKDNCNADAAFSDTPPPPVVKNLVGMSEQAVNWVLYRFLHSLRLERLFLTFHGCYKVL